MAPHLGVFHRPLLYRFTRRIVLDRLCRAFGDQLRAVGTAAVVSVRVDPASLSYPAAERTPISDLGNAVLRCRAALGDRRSPGVLAGAGTDRSLLRYSRRDLLADPTVRAVQPAQAHSACARRHRVGAHLPSLETLVS